MFTLADRQLDDHDGQLPERVGSHSVLDATPSTPSMNQPRLAKDPKVVREKVGSHLEPRRQLADTAGLSAQQSEDRHASRVAQRGKTTRDLIRDAR